MRGELHPTSLRLSLVSLLSLRLFGAQPQLRQHRSDYFPEEPFVLTPTLVLHRDDCDDGHFMHLSRGGRKDPLGEVYLAPPEVEV